MPHQIKFILRHTKQHSSCRLLSQAGRKTVQPLQIPVMMVIKRHPAGIIRSHTRKGNPASAASDFHVPVSYTHLDVYKRQPFRIMREQTKEGTMEPKDMGNKIKNARMAKGMTQKELASQVLVTRAARLMRWLYWKV